MTTKDVREMHKSLQAINADVEDMLKGSREWDFLKLARLFRYHDRGNCAVEDCQLCEAHQLIEHAQSEIAEAEFQKNMDHNLQNVVF